MKALTGRPSVRRLQRQRGMNTLERSTLRAAALLTSTFGFGLCGAGPPPEGSEAGLILSGGRRVHVERGCGGEVLRTEHEELSAHTQLSHRFANGVSLSAEGGLMNDRSEGQDQKLGVLSQRVGYHGSSAGIELGVAELMTEDRILVAPSLTAWAGAPQFHAWCDALAGPLSLAAIPLGLGVGGRTERFRWRVGALSSLTEEWQFGPTAHAEGQLKVKSLWVGLGASVHDAETWRGQLLLAVDLGSPER